MMTTPRYWLSITELFAINMLLSQVTCTVKRIVLFHQIFVSGYSTYYRYVTLLFAIYVVNVRTGVENFEFDENDEIQYTNAEEQETTSLSDFTPSNYLRHQQYAGVIYPNKIPNEETKL